MLKRRQEAELMRKNRVLIGYIEVQHPDIYKEACEYHEMLANKYPGKLDIRRTEEYAKMTNNTQAKNRYAKRASQTKQMKLHIPLIKLPLNNNTTSEATQPAEQTQPMEIQDTSEATQPTEIQDTSEATQPAEQTQEMFPVITEKMMDEIITELKEGDPNFEQWFNDIDFDFDLEFNIDNANVSPLEAELNA